MPSLDRTESIESGNSTTAQILKNRNYKTYKEKIENYVRNIKCE